MEKYDLIIIGGGAAAFAAATKASDLGRAAQAFSRDVSQMACCVE